MKKGRNMAKSPDVRRVSKNVVLPDGRHIEAPGNSGFTNS